MIRNRRFLILFVVCIMFTACTALTLREANHDLTNLYLARIEAGSQGSWEGEVFANAALESLAKDAAEQGDKEGRPENKIAFYRIAATAAWQAGSTEVLDYAQKGSLLCEKEGNYEKVPRDCGMLLVIPNMASVDELTKKHNDIQKSLDEGRDVSEEDVTGLFHDLKSRLDAILGTRERIAASKAHPKFLAEIDRRVGEIFCDHVSNAFSFIGKVAGTDTDTFRESQCDMYHYNILLKKMGLKDEDAYCLPPGIPAEPDYGCS